MTDTPKIDWPGKSGTTYTHSIHPIGTTFKETPANFVFAKEASPEMWVPIYIGQTKNLSDRKLSLEKEEAAKRNGATHIHIYPTTDSENARIAREKDLITQWKPTCNA
ncbi:MAG: hypothetical protein V4525_15455 [Pseudomonadota bacterium]